MKRIVKTSLFVVVAAVAVAAYVVVRPEAFFPHRRMQIILPFDPQYDAKTSMIPMGRKIFHPDAPLGHPGIDFQWNEEVPIVSSSDGRIVRINHGSSHGIDVTVQSGVYELRYKEMDEARLAGNTSLFHQVNQGDVLGCPGKIVVTEGSGIQRAHYQLHWEFASVSLIKDRFCPVNYFTPESKARIEQIWDAVPWDAYREMKKTCPDICSGGYKGKEE